MRLRRFLPTRRRLLVTTVLAGTLFVAYGAFWEARRLELVTCHVALPGLPRQLEGYRIVQLSDFHRGPMVPDSLIRRAVDLANSSHADAAVLTGDFIDWTASNAGPCASMLSRLRTRAGSYAVLGNHEHWTDAPTVIRVLKRQRVRVLDNSSAEVAPGLYLVGIDDEWAGKPDVRAAFGSVRYGACYVMLSHNPRGGSISFEASADS